MKNSEILYILSNGRVAAINKKDGLIMWEVRLKNYSKSTMVASIGQLHLVGSKLFIGIAGIIICLQAKDGALVWINELKGWGYQFVSMVDASFTDNSAIAAIAATNEAAQSNA